MFWTVGWANPAIGGRCFVFHHFHTLNRLNKYLIKSKLIDNESKCYNKLLN